MSNLIKWLLSIFNFLFKKKNEESQSNTTINDEQELVVETDNNNSIDNQNHSLTKASCSDNICIDVINEATKGIVVYIGKESTLDISLQNSTGADLPLKKGAKAPTLVLFPPAFYTSAEVEKMSISFKDWAFTYSEGSLILTYNGADSTWKSGAENAYQIKITGAKASGSPKGGNFQINFENFTGSQHIPLQLTSPMTLSEAPKVGNAKLSEVLDISLDDTGRVFVSPNDGDKLQNTLFLNIKNTGASPLYTGTEEWPSQPRVDITFIYGNTSGALAPSKDRTNPQLGSAWDIHSKVQISNNNQWATQNPDPDKSENHAPLWSLSPNSTDKEIIGINSKSNITFSFSEIVSITPIGHTNMILSFSGFYKDEKTPYDPLVLILDINKIAPPATRGIIDFYSPQPNLEISRQNQTVKASFIGSLFQVHKTILSNLEFPDRIPPVSKIYEEDQPLQSFSQEIDLKGFNTSEDLTFTLESFDGNDKLLNSKQFNIHLKSNFFVDLRDGQVYPVVTINGKVWLAHNMNYDTKGGNLAYDNDEKNRTELGYLYSLEAAQKAMPEGWHLPLASEWDELCNSFGSNNKAFRDLTLGGASGFNAPLGGSYNSNGTSNAFENKGFSVYYWTSTSFENAQKCGIFSKFDEGDLGEILTAGTNIVAISAYTYCRYIKNP